MSTSVNAGSRLDRLPIGPFHRRIMFLIGIGMFFDGFDIYLAGTVLGVTLKTGFSTLPQNAIFISATATGGDSPISSTCCCSAWRHWRQPSRPT